MRERERRGHAENLANQNIAAFLDAPASGN